MELNMLAPTRTIGGQRFNVRRMSNYLGADYIIVADVTPEQLTTLGAPDQMNTYLRCQGKTYRWFNNAWIDFFPVGDGAPGATGMSAYQLAMSRGYTGTMDEWLASLKVKGDPGAPGNTGPAGPPNTLSIGAVNSGATPAAEISGASPNQVLNLTLPKGDRGLPGPGNTLSIGTVTTLPAGQSATAVVNGTAPNQTLDLGIPVGANGTNGTPGAKGADGAQGAPGAPGVAATLTIGTITTVAAGGSATASITGTAPNQKLNLGIPAGAAGAQGTPGADGVTPTITIGTVTTLAAGAQATASIVNGKLNLGVPAGTPGSAAALSIGTVATGSPGSAASATIAADKLNLTIPGSKRIETYTGVTDANGLYTVTYPTPFAAVPSVQPEPPLAANQVWVKVTSTVTGFSLRLLQRNVVTLLAVEVLLGATVNVSGGAARVTVIEA